MEISGRIPAATLLYMENKKKIYKNLRVSLDKL